MIVNYCAVEFLVRQGPLGHGGVINGMLHASVQNGAFVCIFARFMLFCAFLCFFSHNGLKKGAYLRRITPKGATSAVTPYPLQLYLYPFRMPPTKNSEKTILARAAPSFGWRGLGGGSLRVGFPEHLLRLFLASKVNSHIFSNPHLLFLGVLIFLGLFRPRNLKFLGVLSVFSCFSLFSRGFMGFRGAKKSLVFWVVFLGLYLNTKEKKIREGYLLKCLEYPVRQD